ncbi:Heat shock protein 70 [Caldicellulosiruptor kronotskyensis 2002]|uniref:Heat shock protein 70 n=1 Tax=Caldicellulosiruptor kronotskyensis (strain DSM 18902 / VKM B-2412 / 2002) TaxID=632348 RepID=E4SHT0_CALK2|nr:Hsp70 family protein [Caldicellulosiruptor kronotskyensis]ADQ47305.1 Heat shock protein 70 [Caldicellulosiruptor kronotskyensis 2002]
MHIGIDLGTTNTVVSYAKRKARGGVEPHVMKITQLDEYNNSVQEEILPSVLFLDFDKNIVVGKKAKQMKQYHPKRTISNSKRYMGTSAIFEIDDMKFTPVDVAAHILKMCKRTIELNSGEKPVQQVTITVPASFNTDQIRDTRNAAIKAGFDPEKIRIIPEPTAAFIDFINDQFELVEEDRKIDISTPKRVLVFDLGGGTCDIVVMDVVQSENCLKVEEKAVGRYNELGGIDFDKAATKYLLSKFYDENRIKEGDIESDEQTQMANKLVVFCEKAKEFFSNQVMLNPEIEKTNPSFKINIPEFWRGKSWLFSITLKEYNDATRDLYYSSGTKLKTIEEFEKCKNIVDPIFETLERYEIDKNSIDYVFATGGMSFYYRIIQRLKELFPKSQVIRAPNPIEAVARGASIFSFYEVEIKRQTEKPSVLDIAVRKEASAEMEIVTRTVLAEAIMIDVEEGLPREIITKNQPVPYKGVIKNSFRVSSPSGIKIDIYAGEDPYDCKMRIQKSFIGSFRSPVTPGTPIDIEYEIDENKYLKLRVIVNDSMNPPIDLDVDSDVKTAKQKV